MDFSLSDHQLLIRDTVRDFMRTEVRPHVKEWERTDHFPLDIIKKLGALGCCGMLTPEAYGGAGLDMISYVLMLEEVARVHVAMSTALAVTNSAVQLPLQYFATEAQKSRYLKPLAAGDFLGAFCLTEPQAGSDAAAIQCKAVPCSGRSLDWSSPVAPASSRHSTESAVPSSTSHSEPAAGEESLFPSSGAPGAVVAPGLLGSSSTGRWSPVAGHYLLSGTKTWVTNGSHAGVYLIFAKTDPAAAGKGITAFLVEPTFPGFTIGRHEDKMGQRSSPSVEIILDNCEVPSANRLGEEGQGLKIALSALDGGRIGIAAQAVGLAQGALDESVKFARSRKAFGKSISEFQAIQFMLADMHTEIEAARALLYHAAFLKDRLSPVAPASSRHSTESAVPSSTRHSEPAAAGEESLLSSTSHESRLTGHASSSAKLYASEMVNRVVYKAVQIHGSLGYSRESEVERMYRDARVISIYEGTSEIQRTIIARDLLRS
jgi:alkylation response protein AidB-like acyl-CoA dehydrogenase